MQQENLTLSEAFLLKANQLSSLVELHNAVLVYGLPGTGKSSVVSLTMKALSSLFIFKKIYS